MRHKMHSLTELRTIQVYLTHKITCLLMLDKSPRQSFTTINTAIMLSRRKGKKSLANYQKKGEFIPQFDFT